MSTIDRLQRLFLHDGIANRAVAAALRAADAPPPETTRWLAHVLAAQHLWLGRLGHPAKRVEVFPDWTVERSASEAELLPGLWRDFLDGAGERGLARTVSYETTGGRPFESVVADVVDQVLLHGAHHRGQIASALRAAGLEPPRTDFLFSVRDGLLDG